ncbi:MAG TPA: efflux RND transporter periplasmic adaptor subunit [Cyclobacteriaceae bacterium]|nr:efflux RND transporter periplasmic adaptor subunit [Cyclobacteriaceae bacterium]
MRPIGFLVVVFLWLMFVSCKSDNQTVVIDTYQVIYPIVKDTVYQDQFVAEIQSMRYVEIRSRLKGYIEKIHVDEGEFVKEGQLLFTVSNKEYEQEFQRATAAYKNAIAELKTAEVEFQNVKILVGKDIVSKAELDMAASKIDAMKAKVDEAEANKNLAATNLSFALIKAPFAGTINRIPKKVGSLIEESEILTSISDNTNVFAYFNLSENEYLNYITNGEAYESKSVSLVLANNEAYNYEGRIEIIESEFDRLTGNIAFRAKFPNPDDILKHGSNGKVIIEKDLPGAIFIPQKSTFEIQDKLYVYVLKKDSVLEQRNINIKMRYPHFFVLESGLSAKELIVFEGVQRLRDGEKILPDKLSAESIQSLSSL